MNEPHPPVSGPGAGKTAPTRVESPQPARAARRRSMWNLLPPALLLPLWFAFGYAAFELVWRLHLAWHPQDAGHTLEYWRRGMDGARFLMLVPPMVAALPLSMVLANFLVHALPPARRALTHGASEAALAHYAASQRALLKFAAAVVAASLGAAVLGAWMG